jgi:TPR repeat protein
MEDSAPAYKCFEGMKVRNIIRYLDRYMDCDAMFELAYRNFFGVRMRPNKRKALYWFYNSAILGNEMVMYMLGTMYASGEGCRPDVMESAYWFAQGAEAGHAASMNSLAIMYAEGIGVEQSDEEAIALWEKAVEAGSEEAATNLKITRGEPVDD